MLRSLYILFDLLYVCFDVISQTVFLVQVWCNSIRWGDIFYMYCWVQDWFHLNETGLTFSAEVFFAFNHVIIIRSMPNMAHPRSRRDLFVLFRRSWCAIGSSLVQLDIRGSAQSRLVNEAYLQTCQSWWKYGYPFAKLSSGPPELVACQAGLMQ